MANTTIQAKPILTLVAALALSAIMASDALAAVASTAPPKPTGTSIPTTPTVPTRETPPPVVITTPTTPTPPARLVPDRNFDMPDVNPVNRVGVPTEITIAPRRATLNRLENRSATPRAFDPAGSVAAKPGAKPQARDLLESAKPIL